MSERMTTILNLRGERERVKPEPTSCSACGMHLEHGREYHPYAACLMFKACRNGRTVTGNLHAVVEFGKEPTRA